MGHRGRGGDRGRGGAGVSDALGGPLRYNKPDPTAFGVMVAAPGIHDEALAWIKPRAETASIADRAS